MARHINLLIIWSKFLRRSSMWRWVMYRDWLGLFFFYQFLCHPPLLAQITPASPSWCFYNPHRHDPTQDRISGINCILQCLPGLDTFSFKIKTFLILSWSSIHFLKALSRWDASSTPTTSKHYCKKDFNLVFDVTSGLPSHWTGGIKV